MTAIFLSDVHLRDSSSVKTKLVIRFLQEVASRHDRIYILGDLFDVWPGTNAFLVRTYRPVILALKQLVEDGHEVHYIEGNHDFRLGDYFTSNLHIQVHPDGVVHELGGRKVLLAHGDLGNPKQFGYRILRKVLRASVFQFGVQMVPQSWLYEIASRSSRLSRTWQDHAPADSEQVRQIYRKTAESLFERGMDVVVMGHTHIPDEITRKVNGKTCRYFNTGDWVRHFTYLEFDGSEFYTKVHPVKAL